MKVIKAQGHDKACRNIPAFFFFYCHQQGGNEYSQRKQQQKRRQKYKQTITKRSIHLPEWGERTLRRSGVSGPHHPSFQVYTTGRFGLGIMGKRQTDKLIPLFSHITSFSSSTPTRDCWLAAAPSLLPHTANLPRTSASLHLLSHVIP